MVMNIICCVKQVPDTTEVRIDPEKGTLIRDGVPSILNPYDQFAVEEGCRLRDSSGGGKVTVLTMGPPQARSALMKCLALGADEAVLLSDRAFAGSDTWATANALALAIKKLDDYDLVLCGQQAIDGDTGQVGPELAQRLSLPQVTYVEGIEIDGHNITLKKQVEDGFHYLETKLPALLALMPPTDFEPGIPPMSGILKAKKKSFHEWSAAELDADVPFGLDGSLTQVVRTYSPPARGKGVVFDGPPSEAAARLARALKDEGLTRGMN